MYSYSEFKKILNKNYGFSEKEIFYIIGVFFDKTNGFTHSHEEEFYDLREHEIVHVKWSVESFGWDYQVYDTELKCCKY